MIKKLIAWIKPSLEGTDGKSSSKAITLLWVVVLATALHCLFGYIAIRILEKEVATETSLKVMDRIRDLIALDWIVMLILFGVATVASLVQLFKSIRGQTTDDTILIEKETKTSESVRQITNQQLKDETKQDNSSSNNVASDS